MKPGWKTSEFWLALVPQALGSLLASGAIETDSNLYKLIGLGMNVLATFGYGAQRTWLKARELKAREMDAAARGLSLKAK